MSGRDPIVSVPTTQFGYPVVVGREGARVGLGFLNFRRVHVHYKGLLCAGVYMGARAAISFSIQDLLLP